MSLPTTLWGVYDGVSIFSFNFWAPHFLISVERKPENLKKKLLWLNYVGYYKFLWAK